ncbi:hypothetical protein AB0M80_43580 [Amycolatopsis sp. NPDC051045]|uniref:hypothetical protein n=1 Tax=Amycolatopsis sp. NPDC051045 TaxID=3156922 RepID=UPI003443D591
MRTGLLSWIVGFAGQPQALAAADLLVGLGDLATGAEPGPALMAGRRGQRETVDPGHPGDLVSDVGAADVQPHPGEEPMLRRSELHRVDPGNRPPGMLFRAAAIAVVANLERPPRPGCQYARSRAVVLRRRADLRDQVIRPWGAADSAGEATQL